MNIDEKLIPTGSENHVRENATKNYKKNEPKASEIASKIGQKSSPRRQDEVNFWSKSRMFAQLAPRVPQGRQN